MAQLLLLLRMDDYHDDSKYSNRTRDHSIDERSLGNNLCDRIVFWNKNKIIYCRPAYIIVIVLDRVDSDNFFVADGIKDR